uniref:5'-AMP-activated protein kinase subunit beta-1 n=1 Tax=Syphacia muris TaxID=451379 RepID=A0A0N5AB69_9BILA
MDRVEVNSLKGVIQQREAELNQKNQMIEQMLSESKELKRKVDLLTQNNTLNAQRAQEIEAQASNARRSFEEKLQRADKTATELQIVLKEKTELMERMLEDSRRRASELEKQILIAENGANESEREKQRLLQENLHYKSEFSKLEEAHKIALDKVAREMREMWRKNEEDKTIVSSKLKEANEEIATLNEVNGKLEDARNRLKREVDEMKSREESIAKKLDDEKKKCDELRVMIEEKENNVRCAHCAKSLSSLSGDAFFNGKLQHGPSLELSGHQKPLVTETVETQVRLPCIESQNAQIQQLRSYSGEKKQNLLRCIDISWVNNLAKDDIPKEVRITGSFWDWKFSKVMERNDKGFSLKVELPVKSVSSFVYGEKDAYQFKFIVDGTWRCSDRSLEDKLKSANFANISSTNGVESELKKKVINAENAKPAVNEVELSDLKERLLCQERKNEELRASNYQLVEVAHKQEQNLLKKMKDIEAKNCGDISRCLEETEKILHHIYSDERIPPIPKKPEIETALAWFENARDHCGNLAKPTTQLSAASNCTARVDNNGNNTEYAELKQQAEGYRRALASVFKNVIVVEREYAATSKRYKDEIAQLKAQLAKVSALYYGYGIWRLYVFFSVKREL